MVLNLDATGVSASPTRLVSAPLQPVPVLPSPTIASDNTLGAFSPHQGRLYVAFTGRFDDTSPAPAKDQTDIILLASDDGGQTWTALADVANQFSSGIQVNDDNAQTDGFSGADANRIPGIGRTQLQPQVAVDPYTGSVVLSFLDARNDPSDARVATYIAASNDGGATFAAQTYANATNTAIDAITGNTVNLGPVPDNQSGGDPQTDPPLVTGSDRGWPSSMARSSRSGRPTPTRGLPPPTSWASSIQS